LARLSGIKDPNKIFPGQKVTLPGGGSYTVKKGDTLSGIAQTYRLSQQAKRNNPKVDV
jgi:LysM repeat protein